MNIYRLLKVYQRIRSPRVKLMGILLLHITRRRYINLYLDPVMACNLRCRMCYFSNDVERQSLGGRFSDDDIEAIDRAMFHRVIKLQIGCGAEPTVYPKLPELVQRARHRGIPFISVTTNGNLLTAEKMQQLVEAGLSELTISAHGMTKATYEHLMQRASFDRFLALIDILRDVRHSHPDFRIRLNYTVNEDNIDELPLLCRLFADVVPDVVQIRPIQRLGQTDYDNFSLTRIKERYDDCILPVVRFMEEHGATCLYPTLQHLQTLEAGVDEEPRNSEIDLLPYFNLSPYPDWRNDKIDPYTETFEDYCHRTHRTRRMLKALLGIKTDGDTGKDRTLGLNYQVK